MAILGHVGVAAGSVHAEYLHKQDEHDAPTHTNQHRQPPVAPCPLEDVLVDIWVKDGILETGERPVRVYTHAAVEGVAVAVVGVTWGAYVAHLLVVGELSQQGRTLASVGLALLLATQVAQVVILRAQTVYHRVFQTWRPHTHPIDADLRVAIAVGEVLLLAGLTLDILPIAVALLHTLTGL